MSRCRACRTDRLQSFFEVDAVPTQSCVLLDDPEVARSYPVGDVSLELCERCGFIQNSAFDQSQVDYSVPTEESQAYSARFREFASALAADLSRRYHLGGAAVLEIGCGKGDFLQELHRLGVGSAVGIDPGFRPRDDRQGGLRFIRDWYDERHTDLTADLIVMRHLLEHVPDVLDFLGIVLKSMRRTPDSALFVEVPDTVRILAEGAFWDVYYEHCSYFTDRALHGLLRRAGLEPTRLERGFDDQYLLAEAQLAPGGVDEPASPEVLEKLGDLVAGFEKQAGRARARWAERLGDGADGAAVLWGGGSKTIAFLAAIGIPTSAVRVVDINPHKQGKFLPASAVEVEAPETLRESPPQLVVVMNPIYSEEIRQSLFDMEIEAKVLTVND